MGGKCICGQGREVYDSDSGSTIELFQWPDTGDWWFVVNDEAVIVEYCPKCGRKL